MSQLELFIKPVQKKIINNVEYGEVKIEDIMPNISPNQYILYPTGGYHYFCNIKYAPEKYRKPIWVTEMSIVDNDAKTVSENTLSLAQTLPTMKSILSGFYQREFVHRFAWFSGTTNSPNYLGWFLQFYMMNWII